MHTLQSLRAALDSGATTSRALTEAALERIADPEGEGSRTFIRVFADEARAQADRFDRMRAGSPTPAAPSGGRTVPVPARPRADQRLAGIPIAVKDLVDVVGHTTLAGSVVRDGAPPAGRDAPALTRLRLAGAVLVGSTNMSEFALGTPGTNAHFGTPRNPWDRPTGRLPGGSSSGSAVAVCDGMAAAAVGTDTAGSVRVPAAFCGLVGYKPTARRVPLDGIFPLSASLDSVGALGWTVPCAWTLDQVLAGEMPGELQPAPLRGARFGVLTNVVLDGLEAPVAEAYETALRALSSAGAQLEHVAFPELDEIEALGRHGGLSLAEALEVHRRLLESDVDRYDPLVARRLRLAMQISASDRHELLEARGRISRALRGTQRFDALLMPTCPVVAPPIASVADDANWMELNRRLVRVNILANFLDRCALSVPCGAPGEGPVGLTMMGETLGDRRLLDLGAAVERAVRRT